MSDIPSDLPAGLPVATSYRALWTTPNERREVRAPRRDEFPPSVGWYRDPELGIDVPAVIGLSGRFAGVGEFEGHRAAQWQLWVRPNADRVALRLSREDLRDIVNELHRQLGEFNPMPGATYTAYFAPGNVGGENMMRLTFSGGRRGADPWLANDESFARVRDIIAGRLEPVFQALWNSWTKDPAVSALLAAQRIPVAAGGKTRFHADVRRDQIRDNLPEIMRRTVFLGGLERVDLEELCADRVPIQAVDWNHLFTMMALGAIMVAFVLALVLAFMKIF